MKPKNEPNLDGFKCFKCGEMQVNCVCNEITGSVCDNSQPKKRKEKHG